MVIYFDKPAKRPKKNKIIKDKTHPRWHTENKDRSCLVGPPSCASTIITEDAWTATGQALDSWTATGQVSLGQVWIRLLNKLCSLWSRCFHFAIWWSNFAPCGLDLTNAFSNEQRQHVSMRSDFCHPRILTNSRLFTIPSWWKFMKNTQIPS